MSEHGDRGVKGIAGPARGSAGADGPEAELRRLGTRLLARADDVCGCAEQLNLAGALQLDPLAHRRIARVIAVATEAVARWMAGEGVGTARQVGREAGMIFSQLAIQRAAPLDEITKRALRWRDASWEVLTRIAAEDEISDATLRSAQRMLQRSLDVTLVRLGEAFEAERIAADRELERRQEDLVFVATHDTLTGLPNRTLILDRAGQLLARSRREHVPCGALLIDLDGFKQVNDGLGHRSGDQLLQEVTARLRSAIREADTLGRLGGDEFVVLVDGLALAVGPGLVAERVLDAFKQPFELAGAHSGHLTISASIGIATGPRSSPADLLRDADIAMYRAKHEGKGCYVAFEDGMQDVVHNRVELEMDIREAVANGELYVIYQPMFDLDGLTPVRLEALLRWRRPTGVAVGPEAFIPILEDSGLIDEVGRWVLREACARCVARAERGTRLGVAVNVSAVQLEHDRFVQDVADALAHSGLDPAELTIEITETALMRDPERTGERLRAIKALGVRLSIDDFGTGYSSLAYLQRFPVDELKIDRSFVSRLIDARGGGAIVRTFVQLARALAIETVAEGIEDQAQLSRLRAARCDIGQGFLFAHPLEAGECERFLERWQPGWRPALTASARNSHLSPAA